MSENWGADGAFWGLDLRWQVDKATGFAAGGFTKINALFEMNEVLNIHGKDNLDHCIVCNFKYDLI